MGGCLDGDSDESDKNQVAKTEVVNTNNDNADNTDNTDNNSNNNSNNNSDGGNQRSNKNNNNEEEVKVDAGSEEAPAGAAADPQQRVVIRKEIRSMSSAEQKRFFAAVQTSMRNKAGPGTSEFFRCAGYHGQPSNGGRGWCHHSKETFPGWHRIYLFDFELALQAADKLNGGNGDVALAYWDWTKNTQEGLPQVVRDNFSWPEDLFSPAMQALRDVRKGLTRANNSQIARELTTGGTTRQATDCLREVQHNKFASSRATGMYPSIEDPHNSIHVVAGGRGGQLSNLGLAAFDLVFWLHHCNVDRIYEGYIRLETDSAQEFENFQNAQSRDLYDLPLEPFKKPNGDDYFPKDTFSTRALGYAYDVVPAQPPQQLRMPPTLVIFEDVKKHTFDGACYGVYVYIVDKNAMEEFKEPVNYEDVDADAPNYGGYFAIFNRGAKCENCVAQPPVDLVVDVTVTMQRLALSRYNAVPLAYMFDVGGESDALIKVQDHPILTDPKLTGPLFESVDEGNLSVETNDNDDINNNAEVAALQKYLQRFGYYGADSAVDGDYGPVTEQAVRDYQAATADIAPNGVACPRTRKAIMTRKRCANIDPFAKNEVVDPDTNGIDYGKPRIAYSVGVAPGYLKREAVLGCFSLAFGKWAGVCGLSFARVDDEKEADIQLSWSTGNEKSDVLRFDGPGGVLGHGGNGFVQFDFGERWTIGTDDDEKNVSDVGDQSTWYRGQPTISLYYTALHEIGHALGLDHAQSATDLMSPYYNPAIKDLQPADIERIQAVYGGGGGNVDEEPAASGGT